MHYLTEYDANGEMSRKFQRICLACELRTRCEEVANDPDNESFQEGYATTVQVRRDSNKQKGSDRSAIYMKDVYKATQFIHNIKRETLQQ